MFDSVTLAKWREQDKQDLLDEQRRSRVNTENLSAEDKHGADYEDRTLPSTPVPLALQHNLEPDPKSNPRISQFPEEETLDEGAAVRYKARVQSFKADGHSWPRVRHFFFWMVHNVVVHPMLGLVVNDKTTALHDLSSQWLNKANRTSLVGRQLLFTEVPVVQKRGFWLLHNVLAHVLIGFLPCKLTFAFHDWTAKKMSVPGWV